MANESDWTIVFYLDSNGDSPVEDFVDQLDKKTQARLLWSLEQLRLRNIRAHAPLVRQIDGKLWELREESRTNIYRVFYFFYTGRQIVLLHGFQKKSQKTPRREIVTAQNRLNDFVARMEGED